MKHNLLKITIWLLSELLNNTEYVFFIQGKGGVYKPKIRVDKSITKNSYIINLE